MAYSTPPNFVAGAVLTEANLDVLSDDIAFLANPPKVRVYNSANQSIAHNTATAITFDSEDFDTDTMHSTAVNTSRLTFTTAGTYMVGASVEFASSATGIRRVDLTLGGTTTILSEIHPAVSGDNTRMSIATLYPFTAGQYIECIVTQTSGGALNVLASANHSPRLWGIWQSL